MSTFAARRGWVLALAYLGFVSLGLPDGLLGVAWPSIRTDIGVSAATVGLVVGVATTGYLLSSVAAGFAIARLGVGRLLAGSTGLVALALAGYASSRVLAMIVVAAFVLGLGSGAIDSGLNAYAAGAFGPRHMSWLHASYGLGVTIGPLIMTGSLAAGLSWRWGYGFVAGGQALLATAFALTVSAWVVRSTRPAAAGLPPPAVSVPAPATAAGAPATAVSLPAAAGAPRAGRVRGTLTRPTLWLSALMFGVYVGIEAAAGLWAYPLLTDGRGMGSTVAGIGVAIYWGSLFVGRLVFGVTAERRGAGPVLVGALAGIVAGTVIIAVPGPGWVTIVGLIVLGAATAPVFPLLMLTTGDRVGAAHVDRAVGVQVGSAAAGGTALVALAGLVLQEYGVTLLGAYLLVLAAILVGLYALTRRIAARHAVGVG